MTFIQSVSILILVTHVERHGKSQFPPPPRTPPPSRHPLSEGCLTGISPMVTSMKSTHGSSQSGRKQTAGPEHNMNIVRSGLGPTWNPAQKLPPARATHIRNLSQRAAREDSCRWEGPGMSLTISWLQERL